MYSRVCVYSQVNLALLKTVLTDFKTAFNSHSIQRK